MKWSELKPGTIVKLIQPLYNINVDDLSKYRYYTAKELDDLTTLAHGAGSTFTLNLDDECLESDVGNIGIEVNDLIDTVIYKVIA